MNEIFKIKPKDIDISYFSESEMDRFDIVFGYTNTNGLDMAKAKFNNVDNDRLVGVILYPVVDIDPTKQYIAGNYMVGSKIDIMTKGEATMILPKKWKLPQGQPLYVNGKGKIGWRRTIFPIGHTTSSQDIEGRVDAILDFEV